jgi:hypothetical protein
MTDSRDRPDATARWRATIEALEAIVLAAADEPEIDPTEAEEVRRLVMVRTAQRRRNTLPAAWVRRPGILPHIVPDTEPAPRAIGPDDPTPRSPNRPVLIPPAWHE